MALPEHAPHIPHIPVPDLKGGARWLGHHWPALTGAVLTAASAGLTYQLFFNPDRGSSAPISDNAPASDTFKPPSQSPDNPSVSPSSGTGPDGSDKPKQPATEAKKELDCGVVDIEYRKYAELIDWKNPSGQILKMIGFRFPEGKMISIKTPIKGQVAYTESNPISSFKGIVAIVSDPNNLNGTLFRYRGNLQPPDMLSKNVALGDEIGFSKNSAQKVLDNYDYDLVVSAQTGSNSDEEALRKACPEAFQKPAVFIDLNLASAPRPPATYTDVFIPRQR